MNNYIFETKDILGDDIKLKQTTWKRHVIGEHAERENFKNNETFFKEVVENPDYIFQQKTRSNKERYRYTFYGNIEEQGNPKVYSVIAENNGFHKDIVTILHSSNTRLTKEERTEEAKIYDRKSRNKDW